MPNRVDPSLWAKSNPDGSWHPLILHLLDVAATADAIMAREPMATRNRLAAIFGLPWHKARPWLLLLIACHDLGKACPGFQCKWKNMSALPSGLNPDTTINHAFVSQISLETFLVEHGWPEETAILAADAVGCHHGDRASPVTLEHLQGNRRAIGGHEWHKARRLIFETLMDILAPEAPPVKPTLSGPDFMLLAGLASFADWIGSNEIFFTFGRLEDCYDLPAWFGQRQMVANDALDRIGWFERRPLTDGKRSFDTIFPFQPRPLQQAMIEAVDQVQSPAIILVEAPMGEGKTEAALYAHLELQRRFGHRGLYVALPTKATGNAMFHRVLEFMRRFQRERPLDLQLLHGAALLNDEFQKLRIGGIHDSIPGGAARAMEWFTHKKRALLSEYGVGTIDQALLTILPVRHQFVRLWGLANRVVIFDEIHAYDAYTSALLLHLIRWLMALGSSVILLSATLPSKFRQAIASMVHAEDASSHAPYPRISIIERDKPTRQIPFTADLTRKLNVRVLPVSADLLAMKSAMDSSLANGGYALALTNTVQRAQDLYCHYGMGTPVLVNGAPIGKRLSDGTEVYLFHARFPATARKHREDAVLHTFGPNDATPRHGRKILVATQVVEQSLDLDFDLIACDLAPIDLVLQRAGRLWRHSREKRALDHPVFMIAGLMGDKPPLFGAPLFWNFVYREDLLLKTWQWLKDKDFLHLPGEIDAWVQAVYGDVCSVDDAIDDRLSHAMRDALGKARAHEGLAHHAIIGLPDDASWKSIQFTLHDDESRAHPSLKVKTRLGENSIVVIPIFESDAFDPSINPEFKLAMTWYNRAMSISRQSVVQKLRKNGVPAGWKKNALLRDAYPLALDKHGHWAHDNHVWLSEELGVVFDARHASF